MAYMTFLQVSAHLFGHFHLSLEYLFRIVVVICSLAGSVTEYTYSLLHVSFEQVPESRL